MGARAEGAKFAFILLDEGAWANLRDVLGARRHQAGPSRMEEAAAQRARQARRGAHLHVFSVIFQLPISRSVRFDCHQEIFIGFRQKRKTCRPPRLTYFGSV